MGAIDCKLVKSGLPETMKETEAKTIGDLLPDDDDLLASVIDGIECDAQTNSADEDPLFCSGGGMEVEPDKNFNSKAASDFPRESASTCLIDNTRNVAASKLFYGVHPSRALIVRNVNSIVEDTDLRILFEQFGDIHTFCTSNKHLGFIIVSYYDLRAAMNVKRVLQDRPLKQQKLDILFYDTVPDKNIDLATLNVVNLSSVVSSDQLHQIFGSYGDIKAIFYGPFNRNQRTIEFYDARDAEAALCDLNMSLIAGKRIVIQLGYAAGWQSCSGKHPSLEVMQEKPIISRESSSLDNPSSVSSGSVTYGANTSMSIDSGLMQNTMFPTLVRPLMENDFLGIPITTNTSLPTLVKERNHGIHSSPSELGDSLGQLNFGSQSIPTIHPHSLPDLNYGLISNSTTFSSLRTISPLHTNINSDISDGVTDQHFNRSAASCVNNRSSEHKEACGLSRTGSFSFLNRSIRENLHLSMNNIFASPQSQLHGLSIGPLLEECNANAENCLEPAIQSESVSNTGFNARFPMPSIGAPSHHLDSYACAKYIEALASPAHAGSCITLSPASYDAPGERVRNRQNDLSAIQADNRKKFELDIDRIIQKEDHRTTLMIKNIPNKYTSKMLLYTIDERHKGTYDFIYLPIDFKNKCNVGYAFINLIDPKHIIHLYQAFNGKKWEKFNSEKVASLSYARIQGKAALVTHFRNSSLMNEDKRFRPILFHSDGPKAGNQLEQIAVMAASLIWRASMNLGFNFSRSCLPECSFPSVPSVPRFSFGMELMAVPKKKVSRHRKGLRNGPKALKPIPVIVRCKCCGRVKLPHYYCCSGNRGAAGFSTSEN